MRTGYNLVWLAAERTPDHIAIVDDKTDRSLTYRELIEEVDIVAAGLFERGVKAGDRIATALPNVVEHCLVLLALQRLAAVPALMNFRFPPAQIAKMIADGAMTGAIVLDQLTAGDAISQSLPKNGVVLTVSGPAGNARDLCNCRGDVTKLPPIPKPHPEEIAFIFYTSGTTGNPKGVLYPHRTTEYRIESLSPITGLRAGTHLRSLGALPLFHGIGFYCVFMTTLAYNGTYYLMSAFDAGDALDMIEQHRITFLFAVPTVLRALVAASTYRPHRVSSLELVGFGGAPISRELLKQISAEWHAQTHHLYGTTETYIPLHNPAPRDNPNTLRSVYPHHTRVVRIGGGSDDIVESGQSGELIVDANNDCMFSAYLNEPEVYAAKVRDGWYFTGDVCLRREDGDVDFVGRVDDAIRSGGESIYPSEIEQIICENPAVQEACVIGLPDSYWGEKVVACVVAKASGLTSQDLDLYCQLSPLARFKRPREYFFVDSLPRNASNKILRHELRQQLINHNTERLSA